MLKRSTPLTDGIWPSDPRRQVVRRGMVHAASPARRTHLESMFVDGGLGRTRARALAALTITSAEGAVAVARAEQDLETFELVARQVVAAART